MRTRLFVLSAFALGFLTTSCIQTRAERRAARVAKIQERVQAMLPAGTWGWQYTLQDGAGTAGPFQVAVTDAIAGTYSTNYYLCITVENLSDSEQFFDSGEFELVDTAGISILSIANGPTMTAVPTPGVLLKNTLRPKQKIRGKVMFSVGAGTAKAPLLRIKYKEFTGAMALGRPRLLGDQQVGFCG